MAYTQENRPVAVASPLGDDKLLFQSLTAEESMSRLFHFKLGLLSEDSGIAFNDIIGQNMSVRVALNNGKTRYFNGYVTSFIQTEMDNRLHVYEASLVPWLWFLTRTSDCRIFQEMTVPAIIKHIFDERGFEDFTDELSGDYSDRAYCVQYRETDFDFISRLMEEEGIYYYFRHENGHHTLVLGDFSGSHEAFPGHENVAYRPDGDNLRDQETVWQWRPQYRLQTGTVKVNDYDFTRPKADISAASSIIREHAASEFEIYDYPGKYSEYSEGERYARLRIEEMAANHETIDGVTNVRGLATGYSFKLQGHPREDQERKVLVTSALTRITGGDYGIGGGGDDYLCDFTAIDLETPYRSARRTAQPYIRGPQTAIVVGAKDNEIWTDKFGRVKVRFHWDRYSKADETSSCWIRVAQIHAGKGFGGMDIPRVGEEVIVEFLEGDPDQPIITGRVYNGAAMPPYKLPDHATMTTLKSNTSKGGGGFNEIRIEDKKGEEQLFIHAEKNQDTRVKNNSYEWIGNDRHLVVKNDQVEHVENDRHEKIDRDHVEEIGRDHHQKIAGKEAVEILKAQSVTVKDDVIEVFKKNQSTTVTKDLYIKAANICIEATTNITLKVGGSTIAIEAGGIGIKTSGKVKIESGAAMDIKAGAPLKVESAAKADIKSPATTVKGDGMLTLKGGMVKIN